MDTFVANTAHHHRGPELVCHPAVIGHSHRTLLLPTISRLFPISLVVDVVDGLCRTQEIDTEYNSSVCAAQYNSNEDLFMLLVTTTNDF